jgi:hypothetical protein
LSQGTLQVSWRVINRLSFTVGGFQSIILAAILWLRGGPSKTLSLILEKNCATGFTGDGWPPPPLLKRKQSTIRAGRVI